MSISILEKWSGKGHKLSRREMFYLLRWQVRARQQAEKLTPLLYDEKILLADLPEGKALGFEVFGFSSLAYTKYTIRMIDELLGWIVAENVSWLQSFFPKFRLEATCAEVYRRCSLT